LKALFIFLFSFILSIHSLSSHNLPDGREVNDPIYKFTMILPGGWNTKDIKETSDKDGISYSFERNDKHCAIMLLAFKLTTVKNLDDFIYTMEKDISLNIPAKTGDYSTSDADSYDMKSATYKDAQFTENIYYYRTKLVDAPNNFVYMLRFITTNDYDNSDLQSQIKKISDSFLPTAK
jgi:hypothetical protein